MTPPLPLYIMVAEMDLQERFIKHVRQNRLFFAKERVGVALSGGSDSVALLHLLHSCAPVLDIHIRALHVEHGLRETSVDDMVLVQSLCQALNIPLHIHRANLKNIHTNVEQAAREVRYRFFEECARQYDLTKIAVAHHAQDRAETFLFNLLRGSGMSGLCAMGQVRGNIVRPLLIFSKEEIMDYIVAHNLPYATDETNANTEYTRNYIRHHILPQLNHINPKAVEHIHRTADILGEEDAYLSGVAEQQLKHCAQLSDGHIDIDIQILRQNHPVIIRRLLRLAMDQCFSLKNFEYVHIQQMLQLLENQSGSQIHLKGGILCRVEYGHLIVVLKNNIDTCHVKNYVVLSEMAATCADFSNKPANCEYVDGSKLPKDLILRTRRQGDYIYPLGMLGRKKLKDYLSDKKIPKHLRDNLQLLTSGSEVYIVFGVGISRKCAVFSHTEEIIKVVLNREGEYHA